MQQPPTVIYLQGSSCSCLTTPSYPYSGKMGRKLGSSMAPMLILWRCRRRSLITLLLRIELWPYSGCSLTYRRIHCASVSLLPVEVSKRNCFTRAITSPTDSHERVHTYTLPSISRKSPAKDPFPKRISATLSSSMIGAPLSWMLVLKKKRWVLRASLWWARLKFSLSLEMGT